MATFVSGKSGSISIGGSAYHVTSWSASLETEAPEVTNTNSSGYREYISGIRGGTGTFESKWDVDDPLTAKATSIMLGASVALVFTIGNSQDSLTGNGILTSCDISSSVDGAVEVSGTFTFTGTITYPT